MIDEHPLTHAPETVASLASDPERFNAQREALRRYCYSFLRNESDAEDAVQLTLERALRYGTMHTDGGRWLLAIARNVCRDHVRARATADLALEDEQEGCSADLRVDPEHEVATRHLLASALDVLTPTERRAVGASWLLDQTSYDAARAVGIAHQTLRVHLARARKKLALYLDEAERATAGLLPWLLQLPHRGARRFAAASSRDASWTDRLVAFSAPAIALAVTLASVAVVAHSGRAAAPRTRSGARPSAPAPFAGAAPPAAAAGLTASASAASDPGVLKSVRSLLSPGREQDAYVNDVQPSPNYAQDHTLYASATDTACRAQACGELFVSRDAGHTWTNVESSGLQPFAQLLLPVGSYSGGTFYAFGKAGLQMTTDHGQTFTTLVQDLPGYAGLMPPGLSSYISIANVDLWNFATAPAPGLAGAYPPGMIAEGAALAVPGAAGWRMLQPVLLPGTSEQVLVCGVGTTCAAAGTLPWSANQTNLVASRDGSIVLATNLNGLAVSRDGGSSFTALRAPGTGLIVDEAVAGDGSLLVIDDSGAFWRSSDLGGRWSRPAVVAPGTMAHLVRLTQTASLVLELVKPGNPLLLDAYECSADAGATWSRC